MYSVVKFENPPYATVERFTVKLWKNLRNGNLVDTQSSFPKSLTLKQYYALYNYNKLSLCVLWIPTSKILQQ